MAVVCKSGKYQPERAEKASLGSAVPHPIPYQGSKRNLAEVILSYFPPKSKRLVEPFAGSAAISLAAASKGIASRFLLNDAHEPLAALWREIVHRPDRLADDYEELWHQQLGREKDFYNEVRNEFNRTHRPACFLYLLARCVKAAIRYNSNGEFNNSPDNRRKGALPSSMRQRIKGAALLLGPETVITSEDYTAVLKRSRVGDLIYMDPPYQGVCGNRDSRYAPRVEHEAFCEQLALLNRKEHLYVVSYDGRMGAKTYGAPMPKSLRLFHIEINAGRSSQATLLGRDSETFESLYLSPALASAVKDRLKSRKSPMQGQLFDR
jgi:DNA adenine methylase